MITLDKSYGRLGRFILRRWTFYETNIRKLKYRDKRNAILFFKTLKQFELKEIDYLAKRYYIIATQSYNANYSCFETCKAKGIKEVANEVERSVSFVTREYSRLEMELGRKFREQEAEDEKKRKNSKKIGCS